MKDLLSVDDFELLVSVDKHLEIEPRLLVSAATEMRKSPHLLAYLQKLHLIALADLSKLKVLDVKGDDFKAAYTGARAKVQVIEAVLGVPALAQLHLEEED